MRKCSKFPKNFFKKLGEMHYFSILFKKFNKTCVSFLARLGEKHWVLDILRNLLKFSNVFLRKLQRCIILLYFSKNLTKNALRLFEFGRKTQVIENFETIFLRKFRKMHDFRIFFKRFNEVSGKFSRVLTKNANCWEILRNPANFWWNFYRKIEFLFLKICSWKNRAFGNNHIFYNNFFGFLLENPMETMNLLKNFMNSESIFI